MTSLSSLLAQLQDQFIDSTSLALPIDTVTESLRLALAQINAYFSTSYTIAGLDSDLDTTLPESFEACLLAGSSAFLIDFAARSVLVSHDNLNVPPASLLAHARALKIEFQTQLANLRLVGLQSSVDSPFFTLPIDDPDQTWS